MSPMTKTAHLVAISIRRMLQVSRTATEGSRPRQQRLWRVYGNTYKRPNWQLLIPQDTPPGAVHAASDQLLGQQPITYSEAYVRCQNRAPSRMLFILHAPDVPRHRHSEAPVEHHRTSTVESCLSAYPCRLAVTVSHFRTRARSCGSRGTASNSHFTAWQEQGSLTANGSTGFRSDTRSKNTT